MNKCSICGEKSETLVNTGILNGNLCKSCFNSNYVRNKGRVTYLRSDYYRINSFINGEKGIKAGINRDFLNKVLNELRKRYNMTLIGHCYNNTELTLGYEFKGKTHIKNIKIYYVFKESKINVSVVKRDINSFEVIYQENEVYEITNGKIKKHTKV